MPENCLVHDIANKKHLDDQNLQIFDIECVESSVSDQCAAMLSHVNFKCKIGYSFENKIGN